MKYLPIILILGIPLIVLIVQCIRWNSKDEYGSYGFGMFCGFSLAALFVFRNWMYIVYMNMILKQWMYIKVKLLLNT